MNERTNEWTEDYHEDYYYVITWTFYLKMDSQFNEVITIETAVI